MEWQSHIVHGWGRCCSHQVYWRFLRSSVICRTASNWVRFQGKWFDDRKYRRRRNILGNWFSLEINRVNKKKALYSIRKYRWNIDKKCIKIKKIHRKRQDQQNKLQCRIHGFGWINPNAIDHNTYVCNRASATGLW